MARKRSKLEIVFEIIDVLSREPMNPTRLAMLVNMPYDRLRKLLEELVAKGVVVYEDQGKSRLYALTPQGHRLYEELKRIRRILKDYGILE